MPKDLLIDGRWLEGTRTVEILDKFKLTPYASLSIAEPDQTDAAVAAALKAFERGGLTAVQRADILHNASSLIEQHREDLIATIVAESGFTRTDAAGEVGRAAITFKLSAEEATRITGDIVPIQGAAGGEGKLAYTSRHPVGVVCAITPFNSPLNTPVHKVAPAIAAGCSVVLKPSILTPFTAVKLARILMEAGLPDGWLNVVHGAGSSVGAQLLADERIAFYHFTGSTETGRIIRNTIGLRSAALELGNISATIVCADADLAAVSEQCAISAYRRAGQVCTSTQLVYVEQAAYEPLLALFTEQVQKLKVGDPALAQTQVGPMISLAEAQRVESWIAEATRRGAHCVMGGTRDGAVLAPAIVTGLQREDKLVCTEVFGPMASVLPVSGVDDAIARVNASEYGLATGLFTRDLHVARRAAAQIRTGTLHINSTSSSRVDLMPFGGVKASGNGKEGPHYAVREMTEERLVIFH
jgi:succinate-semialdehyde dehydrogenase/glutarate-semialdehyde dehydrogenase